ncbi:MAG: helix-turn-helix domain-containing protein [Ruminococcaceae bacterium]|nr:helix-turn-helix domain-containing protein [Oscillospiraceae bacterium]
MDKSTVRHFFRLMGDRENGDAMNNRSYYRNVALMDCNQQIDEEPLIVNCAGFCGFDTPFQTRNRDGRADYYLQFVTTGKLQVWIDGTLQIMEAGDFLLTRPKTPYSYFIREGESMGYLWIHFTGFHAGRLLSRLQLEPGRIYTADNIEKVKERFDFLFGEFTNRQRGFDDACASRLTQILVCLSRAAATGDTGAERKLTTLAWLHGHFADNISMGELAAMEHLSESRYRSVFRSQTGFSPSEYRIALRMQHACDLLATTGRSITDISAACGYGDVLYFTRLFKQKIGVPPGEYRNRGRTAADPPRNPAAEPVLTEEEAI